MTTNRISRRNFLYGVGGAVLSLPYLESVAAPASALPPVRMAFFYTPNGMVRRGFFPGESDRALPKFANQNNVWRFDGRSAPVGTHQLTLTQTLEPLNVMRDKVSLITGMDRTFQHGTDSHAQSASCYLTSCAPYTIPNSVYPLARTLDHVAADHIGQSTPFSTLELSCNDHKDNIESIYFDNMSWYGPGHVAPSIRDPRQVYDRLFSTKANTQNRDVTDLVLGNARGFQKRLSRGDRDKFGEYVEAVRAIEKRMDKLDAMRAELAAYKVKRPEEHMPRDEYIRLMGDLMVTALQTGVTNVSTLMAGPERWQTATKWGSVLDKAHSHHMMSHDQGKYMQDLLKVDKFHVSVFAGMIERMSKIEEANGTTLLDNSIVTLGAGLGDGATHQYNDLPVVVAGGGGGKLKLGTHVHVEKGTPIANLWLTQLQTLGINEKRYADSTGTVKAILA